MTPRPLRVLDLFKKGQGRLVGSASYQEGHDRLGKVSIPCLRSYLPLTARHHFDGTQACEQHQELCSRHNSGKRAVLLGACYRTFSNFHLGRSSREPQRGTRDTLLGSCRRTLTCFREQTLKHMGLSNASCLLPLLIATKTARRIADKTSCLDRLQPAGWSNDALPCMLECNTSPKALRHRTKTRSLNNVLAVS